MYGRAPSSADMSFTSPSSSSGTTFFHQINHLGRPWLASGVGSPLAHAPVANPSPLPPPAFWHDRKVFETAGLVLGVFPDLELAICSGEQALAQSFFATIKSWLSEIRKEIRDIQKVRSPKRLWSGLMEGLGRVVSS